MKKTETPSGGACVDLGDDTHPPNDIFAFGQEIGAVEHNRVYVTGQGLDGLYTVDELDEYFTNPLDTNGI